MCFCQDGSSDEVERPRGRAAPQAYQRTEAKCWEGRQRPPTLEGDTRSTEQKPSSKGTTLNMRFLLLLLVAALVSVSAQDYQDFADGYEGQDNLYENYAMKQAEKADGGGG